MFCCWRSIYQEGRVGMLLTSLNQPPFCACPKPGLPKLYVMFLLCSMSSVEWWVIVCFVDISGINDHHFYQYNWYLLFNASKMTSYPMWWPHLKTRPYNLCDDLIPRHDLITYVMTSLQDVTFKLMWWPNSKTWLYDLCDDIIPRHDLITYVLAIGLFLHTIKNKSNPHTRIYFHALVTFIINY